MIGDVNIFLNIEDDLSKAELDVMIAQAEFRGHGYGKEIVLLMIHYCITRLNILSFYCKINKKNHSSLKLFQRLLIKYFNFKFLYSYSFIFFYFLLVLDLKR